MKNGKVPENILKRSVMKKITVKRPEVLIGSHIGEDCAAMELGADEIFVLSTDPITGTAVDIGHLAVQITVNDLASAGAEPVGILLTVLLPEGSEEETLRQIMEQVSRSCADADIQVVGGHTEVTKAVTQPVLSVTGVAKAKKGRLISTGGARAGMDLVVTKWIALEGTSILAKEKEGELLMRLSSATVEAAKNFDQYLSVLEEGRSGSELSVGAMHDVTEGGIFGALWEMAEASGVGVEVELRLIPIRQETIEICEFFDINPYCLISSGSMLVATEDGAAYVSALAKKNIPASIIGKVTGGKDRILLREGNPSYLTPPGADELYKVV